MSERLQFVFLDTVLTGLESALFINPTESVERQIIATKTELESIWGVNIGNRDIIRLRFENALATDKIDQFLVQITESLKSLSFLLLTNLFYETYGQTVNDVNCLGFDRARLASAFQYLLRKEILHNKVQFFQSIIDATDRIDLGPVRRLLTIMCVFESLGYDEGVAVIASYLYAGLKTS